MNTSFNLTVERLFSYKKKDCVCERQLPPIMANSKSVQGRKDKYLDTNAKIWSQRCEIWKLYYSSLKSYDLHCQFLCFDILLNEFPSFLVFNFEYEHKMTVNVDIYTHRNISKLDWKGLEFLNIIIVCFIVLNFYQIIDMQNIFYSNYIKLCCCTVS